MSALRVLGAAVTHGQALPLGVDDPVIAARAVRRALAAASRHASDVSMLAIASPSPVGQDVLARFTRRALGPHGAEVRLMALVAPDEPADALADAAARLVDDATLAPERVAIVIGLALDGTTVALCLGPAALPQDP